MVNIISKLILAELNNGEKLWEQNYDIWSRKIQYLLEDQDLLELLTYNMQPPPFPIENSTSSMTQYHKDLESYKTWNKKSRRARNILLSSMRNDLMLRFDCCQTAKDVWDAVKRALDKTTLARRQQLQTFFDNYKKKPNHTMVEHVKTMTSMILELAALGCVLTEEQHIQGLIRSIPEDPSWDLVKHSLAYDNTLRNFQDVACRLILEEDKLVSKKKTVHERLENPSVDLKCNDPRERIRVEENQGGLNDQKGNKKNKNPRACFCCGKPGHYSHVFPEIREEG